MVKQTNGDNRVPWLHSYQPSNLQTTMRFMSTVAHDSQEETQFDFQNTHRQYLLRGIFPKLMWGLGLLISSSSIHIACCITETHYTGRPPPAEVSHIIGNSCQNCGSVKYFWEI